MGKITPIVEALVAAKATPEMILAAVRAAEADWPKFRAMMTPAGSRLPARAWAKVRTRILRRDEHTCRYCGDHAVEVDHVLPILLGGANSEDNLVACCSFCNRSKGAKPLQEWEERH